jgi:hypothetical protein
MLGEPHPTEKMNMPLGTRKARWYNKTLFFETISNLYYYTKRLHLPPIMKQETKAALLAKSCY